MDEKYKRNSEKLHSLLSGKLGGEILGAELSLGDVVVTVKPEKLFNFLEIIKIDTELKFSLMLSVTAVDWMDSRDERYEVVYHLLSLHHLYRLRVKVSLPEEKPEIDSVSSLWPGANFMEREVWDMYGIKFLNHPDLRRILMYDEFVGHPLRKDYPLQAKQPRVQLRAPEVHNTARNMYRGELVQIRKAHSNGGGSQRPE